MNYIDKLCDHPWTNERNDTSFDEYVDGCENLTEGCLEQLDVISEIIVSSEKQISEFEVGNAEACSKEQIETLKLYKGFADTEARLLLFELDFLTAYKHLLLSTTDWEYRFFVRRIYTLMHEMRAGFVKPTGEAMILLKEMVGVESFSGYEKNRKYLNQFLQKNDSLFKEVRDKTDAHKDDVEIQVEIIEGISVKDSRKLTEEYFDIISGLSITLLPIFATLLKHIKGLCPTKKVGT